jgi:hypothetical protein
MIVASLVGEKPVNDRTFEGNASLATLEGRIDAAHDLKLIDDVTCEDAHLVRRVPTGTAPNQEAYLKMGRERLRASKLPVDAILRQWRLPKQTP